MKMLSEIIQKVQRKSTLNDQEIIVSMTPLYKIMGYKDVASCVAAIKNYKKL